MSSSNLPSPPSIASRFAPVVLRVTASGPVPTTWTKAWLVAEQSERAFGRARARLLASVDAPGIDPTKWRQSYTPSEEELTRELEERFA